jgi:1,5-anhydro-D-fructose reductase (1,5-anhydro-D-mannitol-forming)
LFLGAQPDTVSATYRSIAERGLEDNAVVVVGYPDQKIGVIEAGFASNNPFTIELFGTDGTLTYTDAGNVLTVNGEQVPVPEHSQEAFAQWVDHINNGTRADDNIARAIELTRLVVAANEAAKTGSAIAYS